MNITLIVVSLIAATLLGVLVDWLLKAVLPDKPSQKHIVVGITVVGVLAIITAWSTLKGDPDSDEVVAVTETPSATATPTFSSDMIDGDITNAKVLSLLYGEYLPMEELAAWQPTQQELEHFGFEEDSGMVHTKVFFEQRFQQNGRYKIIYLTTTAPPSYNCHLCAPAIGLAIFSSVLEGWELEHSQRMLARLGAFGLPPTGEVEWVQLGEDNYGILLDYLISGTGINFALNLYAFTGQEYTEVLFISTGGDNEICNESGCERIEGRSTYEFIPGENSDFYDFVVTTTETVKRDDTIVSEEEKQVKYVLSDFNWEYEPEK